MADPVMKRATLTPKPITNQKVPAAGSYAKAQAAYQEKARVNAGQIRPPQAKPAKMASARISPAKASIKPSTGRLYEGKPKPPVRTTQAKKR